MAKLFSSLPKTLNEVSTKLPLGKGQRRQFSIDLTPQPGPKAPGTQTAEIEAGLKEVDITPLPGVPKGGYSAMSQTGVGFRSRIKARVFYLRPKTGPSVCILQADLHAGSAVLRNKVAELVNNRTDLDPANICLTCTHTHSGPGQLLESNFYNRFASHKPGFDWTLFNHIAQRIADAVVAAYQEARPAKIASGVRQIEGLTRNRSIVPYLNNPDTKGDKNDPQLKYQAINPNLYMLRFDLQAEDGCFYPAGAFSNFSIHGTCIPATSDLYSADSWAYVSTDLEQQVKTAYQTPWQPLHGPSQGTHGDIAPDVADKAIGYPEAERIGKAIAGHAFELFQSLDSKLQDKAEIRNGLRSVDVYEAPTIDGIRIASRPMIGTALTAGAYEHSTPVLYHLPMFKHGMGSARWFSEDAEQGRKRKLAGNLQKFVLPKADFPHQLLFQTLQVGGFVLVGVPFEVTVKAGQEIVAAVSQALGKDADTSHICVASLTNGYTGYTTTAEEYEKQYYEGGHTLYGPHSNRFIAAHCRHLMGDTLSQGVVTDIPDRWRYDFACVDYCRPEAEPQRNLLKWVLQPRKVEAGKTHYWEAGFAGVMPEAVDWHQQLVAVDLWHQDHGWQPLHDDAGMPVGDNHYDVELRYEKGVYSVRLYNQVRAGQRLRFRLLGALADNAASDFFEV